MALGPRDTKNLTLLTGWDATELEKYELQDGTTYLVVAQMVDAGLMALSGEIQGDPLWSSLVSYTDEPTVEYRIGSSNGFERHTEYGRSDPKRADTEGHMLPLMSFDRMLGWTWDYLRQARMTQLEADVADAIKDGRDRFRLSILTRLLKRGDDSGAGVGLGSSGYSPGFATTAGSTSVDFVPPSYGGTSFDNTHEHYVAIAGGAFTDAVFTDAKAELREHGHEPPYEFIIGTADESTVRGLTGTVEIGSSLVAYGAQQSLARLSEMSDTNGGYYIGTNNDFAIRVVRGMPQYYGFPWKSYGPNSQRNPLRVRLFKGSSQLQFVAMPEPDGGNGLQPLQRLMLFVEFGVGVGDRTNGSPRYVNNATWADGTPT